MPHRFMLTAAICLFAVTAPGNSSRAAGRPIPVPPVPPMPRIDVLVDGVPRPQYTGGGTRYIEALKGHDYTIRITNPFAVRVAVALAVDGLNTIDARHTTAAQARKWVLGPHETITLSGWQVSRSQARRFHFTTEERSYGQALGRTADLGIISAAFFRERVPEPVRMSERARPSLAMPVAESAPPPAAANAASAKARDEYAATGLGRPTEHAVQEVAIDLEDAPAAVVSLRYEFRAQLVELGVLPDERADDPLERRGRARGFEPGFCPEPRR